MTKVIASLQNENKGGNLRVDLGCGGRKAVGCLGVDIVPGPGVDVVADLTRRFPFEDGSVAYLRAYDAIEHWPDKLHTMNEIWRVCEPGARVELRVPSTDGRGAFQDPTHVSYWNPNSFYYYSVDHAPYLNLCRTYGFKGAFKIEEIREIKEPENVVHLEIKLRAVKAAAQAAPAQKAAAPSHFEYIPSLHQEFDRARALAQGGKTEEAVALLEGFLSHEIFLSVVHNDLGVLSYEQNLAGAALKHFENAVKHDEKYLDGLRNLADLYAVLNRPDEVCAVMEKIKVLEPQQPQGPEEHTNLRDPQTAAQNLLPVVRRTAAAAPPSKQLSEIFAALQDRYLAAHEILRNGQTRFAEAILLDLLQHETLIGLAHNELGALYLQQGKGELSAWHFKQAMGTRAASFGS
jgi:tetratricopeptide (TPR) repeat protein